MLLEGIDFYRRPLKERKNMAWIIKQRATLEEFLHKGMSLREIGRHFHVSHHLIADALKALNLRSERTTNGSAPKWIHHREKLLAMLRNGMKRSEIAKEFGVSRNAIVGACTRLNLGADEIVREKTREAVRQQMRELSKLAHAAKRAKRSNGPQTKKATKTNQALSPWRFNMRAKAPPPDSATRCTLDELGMGKCRYPGEDVIDGTVQTFYCGAQTENDMSSWCPYHAHFVFKRSGDPLGGSPAAASQTGVESPCSPANATRPHLSEAA